MEWNKELPAQPGYYWVMEHDEDGAAFINIVEIVQMPEDREALEEMMEFESPEAADELAGKLMVLCLGDSYAQRVDDPDLAEVLWWGPLEEPAPPVTD